MRTVEQKLFETLRDVVPFGRVYPVVLPQDVAYPAVRYVTVYSAPENSLCGSAGLTRSSVQIDIFAREYSEVRALRESILHAMIHDMTLTNLFTNENEDYDSDSRVFRRVLMFSISDQEGKQ
jgi:hypothetical protein